MTREELKEHILQSTNNNFLLELPTSYGKSKLAIEKVAQWYRKDSKILIVVPRLVLITTWKDEFTKWGYEKLLPNILFSTYVSIPKQDVNWDIIVFDEVHHLSERCMDAVNLWTVGHSIALSATVNRECKRWIIGKLNPEIVTVNTQEAIESNILPEPRIFLIPLHLDNKLLTCCITKNPNGRSPAIETIYANRWSAWRQKSYKVKTFCTAQEYYDDLSSSVEWYKRKAMGGNIVLKNLWLRKAGERLKWLADQKVEITKRILDYCGKRRVLTFCSTIDQSEEFGRCVNSKVGTDNLILFNSKKLNQISAVGMLDEGCNLVDCQIGIFNMLNSSERLRIQRVGRILRHKNPVIIIPYFVDTREAEIVKDMVEGYSPNLITTVSTIEAIKL